MIGGVVAAVIIFGDTVSDKECESGYVNVENNCEETCALSPCKELIKKPLIHSFLLTMCEHV